MYVSYALLRNIDSNNDKLDFGDFRLWRIDPTNIHTLPESLRETARINNWIYERQYSGSAGPSAELNFLGRIFHDLENTILLLRLFRSGDVVVFQHKIRQPDGNLLHKYPTRVMSDYISTAYYKIAQSECEQWNTFAADLKACAAWKSAWFAVARRFFMYGCSKEFEPDFGEVDRVVDFMISLEATLVPEKEFVARRLRNRGAAMAGGLKNTKGLLRDFYSIRSATAHGSDVSTSDRTMIASMMPEFEVVVRTILVAGLKTLPPDEARRRLVLEALYNPSDDEREAEAISAIKRFVRVQHRPEVVRSLMKLYDR